MLIRKSFVLPYHEVRPEIDRALGAVMPRFIQEVLDFVQKNGDSAVKS